MGSIILELLEHEASSGLYRTRMQRVQWDIIYGCLCGFGELERFGYDRRDCPSKLLVCCCRNAAGASAQMGT